MFSDVTRYIRSCRNCLAHKSSQMRPAGLMHASAVKAPWKQVTVHLVGPLPRSTNGHTWLLVMQDRFTKWVELSPFCRATAPAVTQKLTEQVIYRHGCPRVIISDNGKQFTARQTQRLLQLFGIQQRTAPVHAPHCNPVERTNKTVKMMIVQYVDRNHRLWDRHLNALQYAYNTA